MKKLWCTFLTFMMLVALMPPAYVNAAQGIEITEVMYVDADGATHSDLYSYGDKITYKIDYNNTDASSVYVVMAYFNDKKMISSVAKTETVGAGSGTITGSQYLEINEKFEGIYSVKLYVFDNKDDLNLLNNGYYQLKSEKLYSKDLWIVNRNWNNATYANDIVSSEWDGDESTKQFGWANWKVYDYLYANYRGGSCPPVQKTTDEKKFGTAALKIAGVGTEDGINTGYPAGEHIVERIIENGAGTYKFVLFAKMSNSQTNLWMGSRIQAGSEFIQGEHQRTATTDWKKFEYDLDITRDIYNKIVNASGTPSIALYLKLAGGAQTQDIYYDKISFHKTGLPRANFETEENLIIRSKAPAGTDVTVVGIKNDGSVAFISTEEAGNDGICENALTYAGNTANVIVKAVSQNGTTEKSLSDVKEHNGVKYLDLTYFDGGIFKSITQNDTNKPYHMMTLANGAVSYDVEFNTGATGVLVGVSYQNGVMTDYDTAVIANNNATVDLAGGDKVMLFSVNSLEEMKLISDYYILNSSKFTETKVNLTSSLFSNVGKKFNPVGGTIDVEADGEGVQIVVIKPVSSTEMAYIGIGELTETIKCKINEEVYTADAYYEVYISDSKTAQTKIEGAVRYITSTTLSSTYATLNNASVTEADVNSVITNESLQFDLTDYNKLADEDAKLRVRTLFLEYKPGNISSVETVQEILDKATGVVLLSQDAQLDYIKKYGESSLLNSEMLGDVLADETSAFTSEVLRLMKENKPAIADVTIENLNNMFKDAYVTAHFNVVAQDSSDIEEYLKTKFNNEINAQLSRLQNVDDPATVYAGLEEKKDYKNISEIVAKFIELTPVPKAGLGAGSVKEVAFIDTEGKVYNDFYSYGDKITYQINYESDEDSTVYVVMAYYDDKKMVSSIQKRERVNAGAGIITGENYLAVNDKLEGLHSVKLFVFDSMDNMQLVNNGIHTVETEKLYSKDLWYVNRNWNGASHSNNIVSSEWDGDDRTNMFGNPDWPIYNYLYANYRGGDCPPIEKTTEQKKFGNAALKIAGASVEDGINTGYPAGEHIVDRIVENGAGTYKFVLFAKMAESQANIYMGSRIQLSSGNVQAEELVTVTTDWNKFEYDLEITQETIEKIQNDSGTPGIALYFKLAGGSESQDIYYDKISFHKTGIAREELKTPENVVIRSKAAAGTEVTVVGTENGNIKFVSMAKAGADGICENAITYNESVDNVTVKVISSNGAIEKALSSAVESEGVKYLDLTYFDGGIFKSITQNDTNKPYHMMTLANGAVSFDVEFNEATSGVLVGVSYQDGVMTDYDTSAIQNNSATVNLNGGNRVVLFCVNSLAEMKLISDFYTIDAEKLSENKTDLENSSFSNVTKKFNPVSGTIDVEADGEGAQIVVVKPASGSGIAYIGIGNLNDTVKSKIDEGDYPTDADYEIYISDSKTAQTKIEGTVSYVTSSTLSGSYAVLNSASATEADVNSVITTTVLQINLTDYNKISGDDAKRRARELFLQYKPDTIDSVAEVQEILDKATGIVLLSQNAQSEYINKYGTTSGIDSVILAEILKPQNQALNAEVLRLMRENKLAAIDVTIDNLNKIFKDAYVTAHFNVIAKTYGDIMQYMTNTFKNEIGADLTRLSNVNEPSNVYKTMLTKKDYKNIQDINAKFVELTPVPAPPQGDASGSGSGSGSGGGGGGRPSIVMPGAVGTTQPTESVFDDVALTHWAYESIAKLTSKGIISKADNFRPSDSITREEFVKMIVCAFANESDAQQTSFADVDSSAWYANYIQTALDKEWINGMSENQFGIGRNITREDAVVIISRVLNMQENTYETKFSDYAQISNYAKAAVGGAVEMEIISGYEDNSFRPKDSITRAECAKIIDRVMYVKGM